jgi:hypothetical protein
MMAILVAVVNTWAAERGVGAGATASAAWRVAVVAPVCAGTAGVR